MKKFIQNGSTTNYNTDSIVITGLGTLNRCNWLPWEDISVTKDNIKTKYGVDYSTLTTGTKNWIANKYNISDLNI